MLLLYILDTVSIDGAIRVLSDEFSIELINPEQEAYRVKAKKYTDMVSYMLYVVLTYIEEYYSTSFSFISFT